MNTHLCRSLLAGDSKRGLLARIPNRLQAGSYMRPKPEQAPEYWTGRK